jgi:hypothetical protein
MALSPTLRALKLSFDRYFGHEHDGKFHGPYCCWAEYSEGGQHIRCEELASQRHGAFKGTFNAHDLEDEVNLFRVPKGIYEQAFCDDHQEAYQDLLRERLKEIHQLCDSLSRSASPGSEVSHETSGSETDHDHDACQEDKPFDDDYGNSDADQDDESDNEEVLSKNDLSRSRKACVNIFSNGSWELVDSSTHGLKGPVPAVGGHNDAPNNRTAGNAEPAQAPLLEDLSGSGTHTPRRPAASSVFDSASRESQKREKLGRSSEKRVLKASRTLEADPSYARDSKDNEQSVRECLRSPLIFAESEFWREGTIYAFRDKALDLVKIGFTTKPIAERKGQHEKRCKILKGLTHVTDVRVPAYRWIEKVIHQDLAPHRWFFHCECGATTTKQGYTRHKEWFLVDDNVVMRTLHFWADFVKAHPWVQHPRTHPTFSREAIKLKATWLKKLDAPHGVSVDETHDRHDMRIKRWRKLLGIVEPGVSEASPSKSLPLRPAVPKVVATVAHTSTNPPPDSRASKQPIPSIKTSLEEDGSIHTQKQPSEALKEAPLRGSDRVKAIPDAGDGVQSERVIKPLPTKKRSPLIDTKAVEAEISKSTLFPGQHSRPADSRPRSVSALQGKSPFGSFGTQSSPSVSASFRFGDCQGINLDQPTWFFSQSSAGQTPSDKKNAPTSPFPKGSQKLPPPKRPATEAANDEIPGVQTKGSNAPREEGEVQDHHHRPQQRSESQEQRSTTSVPPNHNPEEATLVIETLFQTSLTLAAEFLAKEVHPMPLRTISADLWQLRWPLACSVTFALQSPYMPPALSFVMWSIFLPFFVAELRAWNGKGQK